jgi:polyferredoxin
VAAPEEPIWVSVWNMRVFEISVLLAGLGFLTLILVFQDWLTRHPLLLRRVRTGFLLYTLVFIGWYGLAQLSVINVLTFTLAAMHGFQWASFLIDPMMFILWSFVAVTLLLWGRGVYCGWLCPFGALQELTFQLFQRFRLPRFEIPAMVHERLWALKYIILLVLFGVSLQSLTQAERLAEVEPFKTAITLRFTREWGFVLYAAALVLLSALNRKFYCKYLCPLGAALTIPGKFRIFDWLRRHRECGRPCQVCAVECEVQAIRKNGEINPNECHYCLDCQVTYWNDHKCPPEVERRKRREKSGRARELVRGMESTLGRSGIEDIPVRVEPRKRDSSGPGPENR